MSAPAKWRDRIKVHPAADLFPMMSDDELNALAKDIVENELRQQVVLWTPTLLKDLPSRGKNKFPKEIYLLDGRNRLEAIERANADDPEKRAEAIENTLYADGYPDNAKLLYGDTEPFAYVISANVHRRHLTREQRRELIEKLLKAQPEKSDRQIAATVKASPTTVGTVRTELEQTGQLSKLDSSLGADGKVRPRKLGDHARTISQDELTEFRREAPKESDTPDTIEELGDRKDALRIIDDTVRLLQQRQSEVKGIAIGTRVARVRSLMDALGVEDRHLIPARRR